MGSSVAIATVERYVWMTSWVYSVMGGQVRSDDVMVDDVGLQVYVTYHVTVL